MKRPVTNLCGKIVDMDCDVYLNGELQYGEEEYEVIFWAEKPEELEMVHLPVFKDMRVLFVLEKEFLRKLAMRELGYIWN